MLETKKADKKRTGSCPHIVFDKKWSNIVFCNYTPSVQLCRCNYNKGEYYFGDELIVSIKEVCPIGYTETELEEIRKKFLMSRKVRLAKLQKSLCVWKSEKLHRWRHKKARQVKCVLQTLFF